LAAPRNGGTGITVATFTAALALATVSGGFSVYGMTSIFVGARRAAMARACRPCFPRCRPLPCEGRAGAGELDHESVCRACTSLMGFAKSSPHPTLPVFFKAATLPSPRPHSVRTASKHRAPHHEECRRADTKRPLPDDGRGPALAAPRRVSPRQCQCPSTLQK